MARRKRKAKLKPLPFASFDGIRPVEPMTALEGAVKVCVRYGKKTPEGLTRCLQWAPGPGYAEGPVERGSPGDPKYFIQEARVRADGTPITRAYRYRSGRKPLPYPPRTNRRGRFNPLSITTQERWNALPDVVKARIVQIIDRGVVQPLGPEELLEAGKKPAVEEEITVIQEES
jgi:hypothetical protein